MRKRFWLEVCLAGSAFVLGVITVFWKDWLEIVFHVDPDQGSGALEWALVAGLFAASIALGLIAGRERRMGDRSYPMVNRSP
jgi:hypothetical protein